MDRNLSLKAIEDLLDELHGAKQSERIQIYTTITSLTNRIKECFGEDTPNLNEYTAELLGHCEAIAGLDDGNGHDELQHFTWALAALNKLKSYHCLNVNQSCRQSQLT